jgi:hypothetical protein
MKTAASQIHPTVHVSYDPVEHGADPPPLSNPFSRSVSVADANCYRTVQRIVLEAQQTSPKMAVVVSAMGGKPKVSGCKSTLSGPWCHITDLGRIVGTRLRTQSSAR